MDHNLNVSPSEMDIPSTTLFSLVLEPRLIDQVNACRDYWSQSFVRKLEIGMAILMTGLGVLVLMLGGTWVSLYGFGIAALFWCGFGILNLPFVWLAYRTNSRLRTTTLIYCYEDAIRFVSDKSDARLAWTLFKRVIEGRRAFLLFPEGGGVFQIPKRLFTTEDELEQFRDMLECKVTDGRLKVSRE